MSIEGAIARSANVAPSEATAHSHRAGGPLGLLTSLALLILERRPNRGAKCSRCGCEFPFPRFQKCPQCGSERFRFLEEKMNERTLVA